MTWPFENDTSGIVKRISNRSISANRKRNIFIILTIALASALLSAIVLYGFGVMQETQNRNQKTAQIMYHAISEQQGQELYKQEEIAWVGEFFNAFSEQVNHSTVNFTYANADMLKSQSMLYSGDLPASENEIVVQESFLDSLGYSNELGQTIQIPFSDGTTHDFKLTGILDVKTGNIGRYTAIISKELVRQQYGDGGMIDYYIGLKGAQNMSEEEATNYANTLAQQLKISDDNVIVRSTYFNLKDENHGSDMLFYFLIGFVTFIGSGIVIYSIFYISVASSIRNYGQLRTIGTTKRQIKKMVYREGKLLAAIAIPIGLVIGNVIGYFLIPAGWYWLTTLCVTVGVGLFAFIIVMIAIHTPVKRAAAVSPLEALRYSDYQGKMKESSVLHRKITPASLAKMNLSRQKAKSTLTILSLSLGGVLVVLISTMLVSYDGVAEARGRAFPVGEFNIQLNANQSWDTAGISLSGLQQKNFLNADFINAVESIDGVTGIKHWYYTDAEYRVNGNSGKWIQGFCRDEQQNLEKERIAGTTDYDELVAGNGIVLLQERADLYDIEAALGDTVEVDYKTESGQIRTKAYDILTAYSGQEALKKVACKPDLILLDINMPGMDGLTVCQQIREHIACPILFLTARIESSDKIIGFQAGADDYIVKPFDLDELGARIAAHLRREQRRQNNSAVRFFGELILDYSARTVTINNLNIPLSKREFEIVELLSLNAGQVFDRERIYELVWGLDGDGNSDTIMEHIRKIRAKFAAHTLHNYIETVWGCGYRWNA